MAPPHFDAVLDAVRPAFVDGAGEPAGTEPRPLDPAEAREPLGGALIHVRHRGEDGT
jgi:hypothetical protein